MHFPQAKDVITEQDIETWVSAAVRASLPVLLKESREVLLFAMKEHEKVLQGQTLAMMRSLEAQTQMMSRVIEVQGRSMIRLIAIGGFSTLFAYLMGKRTSEDAVSKWKLVLSYGVGVIAILATTR
mmetsp:Transcript_87862/g.246739  ORF Transcript_87862/g.246739 Transcript_87862/m.246739 type:complete len:126 (-) Transcript_87862:148-525(-)